MPRQRLCIIDLNCTDQAKLHIKWRSFLAMSSCYSWLRNRLFDRPPWSEYKPWSLRLVPIIPVQQTNFDNFNIWLWTLNLICSAYIICIDSICAVNISAYLLLGLAAWLLCRFFDVKCTFISSDHVAWEMSAVNKGTWLKKVIQELAIAIFYCVYDALFMYVCLSTNKLYQLCILYIWVNKILFEKIIPPARPFSYLTSWKITGGFGVNFVDDWRFREDWMRGRLF